MIRIILLSLCLTACGKTTDENRNPPRIETLDANGYTCWRVIDWRQSLSPPWRCTLKEQK